MINALSKCPHMTARCPHYQDACNESLSIQCHYIKRTTATAAAAYAALRLLGIVEISNTMKLYLNETKSFLETILKNQELMICRS